jgi:hypothetical protein
MLTAIITPPTAAAAISAAADYAGPFFDSLLPWGYIVIGLVVGPILILFIVNAVKSALYWLSIKMNVTFGGGWLWQRNKAEGQAAIFEHRRFKKMMSQKDRISRWD